jgi:hypothetical protein
VMPSVIRSGRPGPLTSIPNNTFFML